MRFALFRSPRRSSRKPACFFSLSVIWLLRCCYGYIGVSREGNTVRREGNTEQNK